LVPYSCLMETKNGFSEWLLQELEKREWSQSKLAKMANIKKSTISRIIRGERGVGKSVGKAIAGALNYPPEVVFRMANILDPVPEKTAQSEELNYLFAKLPDDEKEDLLDYLHIKLTMLERSGKVKN